MWCDTWKAKEQGLCRLSSSSHIQRSARGHGIYRLVLLPTFLYLMYFLFKVICLSECLESCITSPFYLKFLSHDLMKLYLKQEFVTPIYAKCGSFYEAWKFFLRTISNSGNDKSKLTGKGKINAHQNNQNSLKESVLENAENH